MHNNSFFNSYKIKYMHKQKNVKNLQFVFLSIILIIVIFLYNFIWLNRTVTLADGWFKYCYELINKGKLPYRDFYYYLPPLNLLIDGLFYKIAGNSLLIYRIMRLIERCLIVELCFFLLSRQINYFRSAIICFMGAILSFSSNYDLIGDYNQSVLLIILCLSVILYFYLFNSNVISSNIQIYLCGIFGGLVFLCKQPHFLACFVTYFCFFAYICLKNKKSFKDIFLLLFGGLSVVIPFVVYLLISHSFIQFFDQVIFGSDGKGNFISIVVLSQIKIYLNYIFLTIPIALLIVLYDLKIFKIHSKFQTIIIFLIGLILGTKFGMISVYFLKTYYIWLVIISVPIVYICLRINTVKYYALIIEMLVIAIVLLNNPGCLSENLYNKDFFNLIQSNLLNSLFIFVSIWLINSIFLIYKKRKECDFFELLLVSLSVCSCWGHSMAATDGIIPPATGIFLVMTFSYIYIKNFSGYIKNTLDLKILDSVRVLFAVVLFSVLLLQKLVCPYSWWDYKSGSFWDKKYTSDVPYLDGFLLDENEIKYFDNITLLIDHYSDKNSVIFGFPYAKIYNVLLDNYNMISFSPIHFYDVISDDCVIADSRLIIENEPDIVVWQDITDCISIHEEVYRNGKPLEQRRIVDWFSNALETDYVLVGQFNDLYIYKLDDGCEFDLYIIDDVDAFNKTGNGLDL